jgi:L-amino acid N-acyltransferase YncA
MSLIDGPVELRGATASDLPAVAEIYNLGIAERVATFETEPRTAADIASWATAGRSWSPRAAAG